MQTFANGTFATFKRSRAWDIFGPHAKPAKGGGYDLFYEGQSGGYLNLKEAEEITGIGLERLSDRALLGLYELASQVPSWISWGNFTTAVTNADFIDGLPTWLLAALEKPPTVVHSAEELLECIASS